MTEPLLNPAVATPGGLAVFALIYIGKLLNDGWRERRERKQEKEQGEPVIIAETKELLLIWKQEVADLNTKVVADRQYMDTLEAENYRLREQLRDEERDDHQAHGGRSPARLRRPDSSTPRNGPAAPGPELGSSDRQPGDDAGSGERAGPEAGGATSSPQ